MKASLSVLLAAVSAATFSLSTMAQPAVPGPARGPGAPAMDCAKAKDKARCERLNKDIEACRDKVGDEWRQCMHQPLPTAKFAPPKARDCAKASNRERCDAHNSALEACKAQASRAEHRKCMAAQSPAQAEGKS